MPRVYSCTVGKRCARDRLANAVNNKNEKKRDGDGEMLCVLSGNMCDVQPT